MKKVITLLLLLLFNYLSKAQSYLIEQVNESIVITDVSSINKNIKSKELAEKKFDIITKEAFGFFSGYEIKGDSLICFFNKSGKLSKKTYYIGSKYDLKELHNKLTPDYDSCLCNNRIHYFKDYKLILGKGVILCQNGRIIWSVDNKFPDCNEVDTSKDYFLNGYISPQISINESSIVFEAKRTAIWTASSWIIEIDINTGIKKKIGKGKNPSYSPDGKYILYKDGIYDWYYIYNRITHKNKRICEGGIAFWLYK